MKASSFPDGQMASFLKRTADGTPVPELCREAGISQATFFNRRKKYVGLVPAEM